VLRICDQGEASIYTGGLRGRKLHNEILALPRRKRNRKCQTADTKASPVDVAWLTAVLVVLTLVSVATCVLLLPTFVFIETLLGATEI